MGSFFSISVLRFVFPGDSFLSSMRHIPIPAFFVGGVVYESGSVVWIPVYFPGLTPPTKKGDIGI
jgi:hypothetical protein